MWTPALGRKDEKMKKTLIVLICIFICSFTFAGGFEDSKKFDVNSVSNFDISLLKENLIISTFNGNAIYVISETTDESMFPIVELKNNTLIIRKANNPHEERYMCHISLMLPENYIADKVSIETLSGELRIKQLRANYVKLLPGPKNSLDNIKADYFEIPIPDQADMNISNLDSKEINISLIAGTVNLSMLHIPTINSKISSKNGKLNIAFPANEAFTINAKSFNSKFINNLNNSVIDWIREGNIYKQNGGGVEIVLQTHTGDIEVRKQ